MTEDASGAAAQPKEAVPEDDGWQWAIIEIFGHRRHAGRIREEERFGAKMLRIDVPVKGDPDKNGWETHWYGGSSIFSLTLTDEASAMRINKPYELPATYRLPAPSRDDEDCGIEDDYGGRKPLSPAERIKAAADRAEARSAQTKAVQAAKESETRLASSDDDGMPF